MKICALALIVALIIILVLVILSCLNKKDKLIILPEESQIPVINNIKLSKWMTPNGKVMYFAFQNKKKLYWYGFSCFDEPVEMRYDIIAPDAIVVHTPSLNDHIESKSYYVLEFHDNNPNKLKMTEYRGNTRHSPIILQPVRADLP